MKYYIKTSVLALLFCVLSGCNDGKKETRETGEVPKTETSPQVHAEKKEPILLKHG
jgi:hypothetical protein